jgi:hypothetical protein
LHPDLTLPTSRSLERCATETDPDEWLSGDDPMTGAQASYLKTLCEQAGMPDAFNDNLKRTSIEDDRRDAREGQRVGTCDGRADHD